METPLLSQKQPPYPAQQNLEDLYDMHSQIILWDNTSTLQALSKSHNQVSSISSNSDDFPSYEVAQTLPSSQNYTPSVSQTFMGTYDTIVPQSSTTQILPIMNTESAYPDPVHAEDWLLSGTDSASESTYVCESRQVAPLHTTSNLIIETQTCVSDLPKTYSTNNGQLENMFFNYQNNSTLSDQSIQEITSVSIDTTNRPTQATSIQNILNHGQGSEFINQNWPGKGTIHQYNSLNSSFGNKPKQMNTFECQYVQHPPVPRETSYQLMPHSTMSPEFPYVETDQSISNRKNPREGRNKVEKQRRDNLNQSIAELSYLVPQVASANRKLDKTSILRLSAHYLRSYNYVFRDVKPAPFTEFTASSVNAALGALKGFLLTTTYKGIVVLASNNISDYLGYNEVDLLGHNILSIIHEDDAHIMTEELKPKPEFLGQNGELIISDEPGAEEKVAEQLAQDKRHFIVRFKKFSQRSNPGQYVSCYVEGSFRKSDKARGFMQPLQRIRRVRTTNSCSSGNDIVFIGVVRPMADNIRAEKKVESFHTEYITYHSIDGEITECDKRISLATGYMTQEVMGINAMNFIHRDDVQWVIMELQQMYYKHSLFSESFYRLMIKNGQFIYMRTRGYLQIDDNSRVVNTLICRNTIIEEDEGEEMLKIMKEKYATSINKRVEHHDANIENPKSPVAVVDPKDLLSAVFRMIQSLPLTSRFSTENHISTSYNSSSLRLTYEAPNKERIVSAVQKMYTFIKTFQQDIQQAQTMLHNQRSLNFITQDHNLPELDYADPKFNLESTDFNGYKLADNNDAKYTFVFGKDTDTNIDTQNQAYRMFSKTDSKREENEKKSYDLSITAKRPLYFEPLQNKKQTIFYNATDLETLQNICKIGMKRSNEFSDKIISKKKVVNYENSEKSDNDLAAQDKLLDSCFSDEDLQKHIDQTELAMGQNASPSLTDLIDFEEFLKEFDH